MSTLIRHGKALKNAGSGSKGTCRVVERLEAGASGVAAGGGPPTGSALTLRAGVWLARMARPRHCCPGWLASRWLPSTLRCSRRPGLFPGPSAAPPPWLHRRVAGGR
jgi:hypothetical protein